MLELEERVERLEAQMRDNRTWAGPGQNAAFADNLIDLRGKLEKVREVQDQHTETLKHHTKQLTTLTADVAVLKTDVAQLKTDVAGLKADMVGVKAILGEILDRLPPKPDDPSKN